MSHLRVTVLAVAASVVVSVVICCSLPISVLSLFAEIRVCQKRATTPPRARHFSSTVAERVVSAQHAKKLYLFLVDYWSSGTACGSLIR